MGLATLAVPGVEVLAVKAPSGGVIAPVGPPAVMVVVAGVGVIQNLALPQAEYLERYWNNAKPKDRDDTDK